MSPLKISVIPPFKRSTLKTNEQATPTPADHPRASTYSLIPEIPAFKPKPKHDLEVTPPPPTKNARAPSTEPATVALQLQLPSTETAATASSTTAAAPNTDWARRLKVTPEAAELARSIDCISNKTELMPTTHSMKPAPSYTNIAMRSDSGASSSAPSVKTSCDEDVKAAELAAKKSRVKQSLIKRARSVAIFSLKLKERRAKEAEKMSLAALEHAKIMAPVQSPGGELDLIGIEQLIQIDDVVRRDYD